MRREMSASFVACPARLSLPRVDTVQRTRLPVCRLSPTFAVRCPRRGSRRRATLVEAVGCSLGAASPAFLTAWRWAPPRLLCKMIRRQDRPQSQQRPKSAPARSSPRPPRTRRTSANKRELVPRDEAFPKRREEFQLRKRIGQDERRRRRTPPRKHDDRLDQKQQALLKKERTLQQQR